MQYDIVIKPLVLIKGFTLLKLNVRDVELHSEYRCKANESA